MWVPVALSVFCELGSCFSLGLSMDLGSRGPAEHLGLILDLRHCNTRAKLASAMFNLNIALAPHWNRIVASGLTENGNNLLENLLMWCPVGALVSKINVPVWGMQLSVIFPSARKEAE